MELKARQVLGIIFLTLLSLMLLVAIISLVGILPAPPEAIIGATMFLIFCMLCSINLVRPHTKVTRINSLKQAKSDEPTVDLSDNEKLAILLRRFERQLRDFIAKTINENVGPSWWSAAGQQDLLVEIKQKAKTRLNMERSQKLKEKAPYSRDLFEYLEFSDYCEIITQMWTRKGGKPLFSKFFPRKETVCEYLGFLQQYRNAILGHDRAILTDPVQVKIAFYIQEFLRYIS